MSFIVEGQVFTSSAYPRDQMKLEGVEEWVEFVSQWAEGSRPQLSAVSERLEEAEDSGLSSFSAFPWRWSPRHQSVIIGGSSVEQNRQFWNNSEIETKVAGSSETRIPVVKGILGVSWSL